MTPPNAPLNIEGRRRLAERRRTRPTAHVAAEAGFLAVALADMARAAGRNEDVAALSAARTGAVHRCEDPACRRPVPSPAHAVFLPATVRGGRAT
ncbi:hypothetical protein BX286_3939 [Streptomyces sp. 3211.6]|uniref:hypothetical protein n=1 Tax=Streptomyces sp. 3211.6 TaxID=1938845 RepID=UPI000EAED491|nr:hypothetical protein BX286_3939 [Streptomyces sp. 3211.6]